MARTPLSDERLGDLHQTLKELVDAIAFVGVLTFGVARKTGVDLPYDIDVVNDQIDSIRAKLRSAFQDLYPEDEDHPGAGP